MVLEQTIIKEDKLHLNFEVTDEAFLEVSLFDDIGQLVYNYGDYLKPGNHDHQVPIQKLSAGTYLLRVAENGHSVNHDIVELV